MHGRAFCCTEKGRYILKEVLIAIASGGICAAVCGMIQFFISRHDSRKDKLAEVDRRLAKTEKDSVRTQLLILMASYPDDLSEILTLAEYYFTELKANFYMTSLFQRWLITHGVEVPGWFQR